MTSTPDSAAAQQKYTSLFATAFTLTNRSAAIPGVVRSTSPFEASNGGFLSHLVCRHMLMGTVAKERLSGDARLHHSERSAFFPSPAKDQIKFAGEQQTTGNSACYRPAQCTKRRS